MQAYNTYKDTGLAWLEKMPSHWEVEKVGALFVERREKVSDKDFSPLSVTKFGIVPQLASAAKSNDGDNRKKVVAGDFVINSRSDRKGSSGFSALTGSVSLINIALAPRDVNASAYLHYLLKSHSFIEEYYRNGRGIVADLWTTRFSEMKTIQLPLPPREEQDKIVQFLDHKLEKIHKFIASKQKLIALLEEQKQAIINQAVTKGLDSNVPMKDSGIDWLGQVPKHWEVNKLKWFCWVNASISKMVKNFSNEEQLVFLPMEKVSTEGKIDCSERRSFKLVKSGFSSFARNDVVVAKITPCFENGKGAFLNMLETEVGYGTTEFITLRPNNNMLGEYLYFITHSKVFRLQGEDKMTGSAGQKRIPSSFISQFTLGIPNIEEQKQIVLVIREQMNKINEVIAKTQQEIDLIQEYKTSLISAVVTGQVDVGSYIY